MENNKDVQSVLRKLMTVWVDFESKINALPLLQRLEAGKLRMEDYRQLLLNHRQQVVEGSRWIGMAAANIDAPYLDQRSMVLKHSVTEHQDYKMLEGDFVNAGGALQEIQTAEKNIGSEALNAWMFHRASKPNPFDMIGAMFIIEGLGKNFASTWVEKLRHSLKLQDNQLSFYSYHAEHDDDHIAELEEVLASGVLDIPNMAEDIVKTAKVTARLYLLQLEEIGNV